MRERHDLAFLRHGINVEGGFEFWCLFDDQGMIAPDFERGLQTFEKIAAVMRDR